MTQVAPAYARRIPFVSACPRCGRERAQWYLQIALTASFRRGDPVEAYCAPCLEFWQLSTDERANLAANLAGAHGGTKRFAPMLEMKRPKASAARH